MANPVSADPAAPGPSLSDPLARDVLIVGGGQAALQIAVSLRELNWRGSITIASQEQHAPYQRPPLSKAFLLGKLDSEKLAFRPEDYYRRTGISLLTSHRIVDAAPPDEGQQGRAWNETGQELRFDQLALATGALPRRLSVPGSSAAGIHYLRALPDAEALKRHLGRAERVLVVGGGFIGLEAAAVANSLGRHVTVIEAGDRLLGRAVPPELSDFYAAAHRRRGVEVLLATAVSAFSTRDGAVTGAELSNGQSIAADLVVVGIGADPDTELAQRLGLDCSGGIVVDEFARTSKPSIVAAGDCVVTPHPAAGQQLVRLESVGHAIDHAKCAAATLAGTPTRYDTVPWFWSDQGTLRLQIAGLAADFDQTVVRGSMEAERFAMFYYRAGQLLAVHAVNSPGEYMAVRRALTVGSDISPEDAADPENPLRPA